MTVDPERKGGLILCKRHHAEFAGPGAAVGSLFDLECVRAIPVGDLALMYPQSYGERQKAYATRQQWVSFTQEALSDIVPLRRAQAILALLGNYFAPEVVQDLPDRALAMLVGVLPKTIKLARQTMVKSSAIATSTEVKV